MFESELLNTQFNQIHDRNDPDAWMALGFDQSIPMDNQAKMAWISESKSFTRQFVLPMLRPFLRLSIGLIQFYKFFFPNFGTSSRVLHHVIVWGLKTFVSPEGNFLLLRHFHLGTQILDFLKDNIPGVNVETKPLFPLTLDEIKDDLILKHDVNLFNFIIDLNRELRLKNIEIQEQKNLNFKNISAPSLKISDFKRGYLNFFDIHTAIEIILPLFQLFLTDRQFWRATQSLQLDETIGIYFAKLLNLHNRLFLVNNKHPLVPAPTSEGAYRLVLHSLSTEVLHAMLLQIKDKHCVT